MKNIKNLLLFCLLFITLLSCSQNLNEQTQFDYIANDNEIIFLDNPVSSIKTIIKGNTYNAIDKHYIDNRYGITTDSQYCIDGSVRTYKTFRLISFSSSITDISFTDFISSLNSAKDWDFRINETNLIGYERILVSALMPRAIEQLDYQTYEQRIKNNIPMFGSDENKGIINITTRNIDKIQTNNKPTFYLLNNIKISEKIFDAINPVYIKSLSRITDKTNKEGIKIETFSHNEVIAPNALAVTDAGYTLDVFLVNGIEIDIETFRALNPAFFKTTQYIRKGNESFNPYLKKYPDKEYITIIIIE